MWIYEKKLQFPIKITTPNPELAKVIITQYGGPDGELGAAIRYLSQRFTMVTPEAKAILNDIGTEELAHLEMVGTIVTQLTQGATAADMKKAGLDPYYADHGLAVFPASAAGIPWSAVGIQSKGDPITDHPIRFLREREVVHMQRFGESLNHVREYLDSKRMFYAK
jgi:spore coat protein JC